MTRTSAVRYKIIPRTLFVKFETFHLWWITRMLVLSDYASVCFRVFTTPVVFGCQLGPSQMGSNRTMWLMTSCRFPAQTSAISCKLSLVEIDGQCLSSSQLSRSSPTSSSSQCLPFFVFAIRQPCCLNVLFPFNGLMGGEGLSFQHYQCKLVINSISIST